MKFLNSTIVRFVLLTAIISLIVLALLQTSQCALSQHTDNNFTLGVGPHKGSSVEFSLIKDKRNNLCLYSWNKNGGWDELWNKAIRVNPASVKTAWYDKTRNKLILGVVQKGRVEIKTFTPFLLWPFQESFFRLGNEDRLSTIQIIEYYPESREFLAKIQKSSKITDDCDGKGEIFKLDKDLKIKMLEKIGYGCVEYSLPRYVGYNGEVLIFSKYKEGVDYRKSAPTQEVSTIEYIYSINPKTLEKETILISSQIPKNVNDAMVSKDFRSHLSLIDQTNFYSYSYDLSRKGFFQFDPSTWPK